MRRSLVAALVALVALVVVLPAAAEPVPFGIADFETGDMGQGDADNVPGGFEFRQEITLDANVPSLAFTIEVKDAATQTVLTEFAFGAGALEFDQDGRWKLDTDDIGVDVFDRGNNTWEFKVEGQSDSLIGVASDSVEATLIIFTP